jgi:hypothetical protein
MYLNVIDNEVIRVQSLEFGVGLCVLQKVEQKLCGLLGPTTLVSAENLGLKVNRNTFEHLFKMIHRNHIQTNYLSGGLRLHLIIG